MDTEEEAKAAIAALDGYSVRGSHIHVEVCCTWFSWLLGMDWNSAGCLDFADYLNTWQLGLSTIIRVHV